MYAQACCERILTDDNKVRCVFYSPSDIHQNLRFTEYHLQEMKKCRAIILRDGIFDLQNIPKNIKALDIKNAHISTSIPNHISTLYFTHFRTYANIDMQNLPTELKKLLFDGRCNFNGNLDLLPPKLETLKLCACYTQKLDNLPTELKELSIYSYYPHQLRNLPKTIEKITIFGVTNIVTDGNKFKIFKNSLKGATMDVELCTYSEDLYNYRLISFDKPSWEVILKSQS
jgi:hypothetical protein